MKKKLMVAFFIAVLLPMSLLAEPAKVPWSWLKFRPETYMATYDNPRPIMLDSIRIFPNARDSYMNLDDKAEPFILFDGKINESDYLYADSIAGSRPNFIIGATKELGEFFLNRLALVPSSKVADGILLVNPTVQLYKYTYNNWFIIIRWVESIVIDSENY